MKPDTSTRLKPIKLQRIKVLLKEGLRLIEIKRKAKIKPTPTATPARLIKGILEAKYLNPIKIIYVVTNDD